MAEAFQPITFEEVAAGAKAPPTTAAAPEEFRPITFEEVSANAPTRTTQPTTMQKGAALRFGQPQPGARVEADVKPGSGGFVPAFKAGLVEDDQTKLRLIAKSLFPDDPKGVERLGFADGKPVFVNDAGELQEVSSKFNRIMGGIAANTPEIVGGTAGSFAASPVVGSTLGAMAGRGVKRKLVTEFLGDPLGTPLQEAGGLAAEGVMNLAGAGAAKGATSFLNRGKVVDFSPKNLSAAQAAQQRTKAATGIDLDLAQASGNRKLISLRNYLARNPGESADIIQASEEVAKGQLEAATKRTLDLVAKAKPAGTSGKEGVNAAEAVMAHARAQVQKEVKPLYEAAYAAVPEVKNKRALAYLKLPYFQEAFDAGQTTLKLRGLALKEGQPPNLRAFDQMKQELDDTIAGLRANPETRNRAAALTERKNEFVAFLDNTSGQAYKVARAKYAELAKAKLEPLEDGVVGTLAKIKNPKVATAAAQIFTDPNVTPEAMKFAHNAVAAQPGGAEAWNGLVRQWMAKQMSDKINFAQAGEVLNPAGKIHKAFFGNTDMRANMRAALPPQALMVFEDLMSAAQKLGRTPLTGSDTASNLEMGKAVQRSGWTMLQTLMTPKASLLSAAERAAADNATVALAEAITNPAKVNQLRRIVKMPPSMKQALLIAGLLGGQATGGAAEGVVAPPADQLPPSMLRPQDRLELGP